MCAYLTALFALALSQLLTASAQQHNQDGLQTSKSEAQKANRDKTGPTHAASVDDPKAALNPDDIKLKQLKDGRITLSTDVVSVTVSLTDPYGRFVTGLGKDYFQVFDDKVQQQITHFTDEDAPVSLGIVYDVSGSMKERIKRSIRALRRFIATSRDDDDFFLIAFNDRARLVEDFTTSADSVLGRLMFVDPHGSTALYDAAYLAVEKAQQGRHPKKALLIISDGQDNNSRYTYKELRDRVKEADVQIYAIGITDPVNDELAGVGRSMLEEIARVTGGRAYFPNAYMNRTLSRRALESRWSFGISIQSVFIQPM